MVEADSKRRAVKEELRQREIRAAKEEILRNAIARLAYDPGYGLPEELRDLIVIVILYMGQFRLNKKTNGAQHSMELSLMASDIEAFESHIPTLSPKISDLLESDVAHLKKLANTTTGGDSGTKLSSSSDEPSYTSRTRPRFQHSRKQSQLSSSAVPLATQLSARLRALRELQTHGLPAARKQVAATASEIISVNAQAMERTIHVLERTKHGALARGQKARAEHLAVVADGVVGKVSVMKRELLGAIYTPETIAALQRYREHLGDTRAQLEVREEEALRTLETYDAVGLGRGKEVAHTTASVGGSSNGVMADIAKRYGVLLKEIEGVKMEIRRLGGSVEI